MLELSERVQEIYSKVVCDNRPECLDTSECQVFEGILGDVVVNIPLVMQYQDEISEYLEQMHPNFKEGWTFLSFCVLSDGDTLWTDSQYIMSQLVLLGLAIQRIEYCIPKKFWDALPGGMPYLRIL